MRGTAAPARVGGGPNWPGLLLAGLIGAGVALAAAYMLVGKPLQDTNATLGGRLSTVEGRLAQLDQLRQDVGEVAELRGQLSAVGERTPVLERDLGVIRADLERTAAALRDVAARPTAEMALGSRLAGIEQAIAALRSQVEQAAVNAPDVPALVASGTADLRRELAALQQSIEAARQQTEAALSEAREERAGAEAALTSRLEETAAGLEGLRGTFASTVEGERRATVEAIEGAKAAAMTAVASASAEAGTAIERLARELQGLRPELGDLRQTVEQRLAAVEGRLREVDLVADQAATLALASGDLDRILDRGGAIDPVLGSIRGLVPEHPELAPIEDELATVNQSGLVLSMAELDRQLAALAPTAGPPPGRSGAGWLGGATSNLGGLVAVDQLDPTQQRLQSAIESARAALAEGDLSAARATLEPLAEDDHAELKAWLADADRRLATERASAALKDRLRAMLAAAG